MAMQSWKSFLMPYEQAVEELKVKLKSIRKEYRKRKGISQENFNSKESQNNKTNSPFSFKPQETLNHSIPVRGGGGILTLI